MKTRKFISEIKVYEEDGTLTSSKTIVSLELTPDEGKCFKELKSGRKIIKVNEQKGAVIQIPESRLSDYIEVEL